MILDEAYEYMDMLLDKADEPYFTTEEKNKFLNLAISEFININYNRMEADENAKKALSPVMDWYGYELSHADIASGGYAYNGHAALSEKYKSNGVYDSSGSVVSGSVHTSANPSTTVGFFRFGAQFAPPSQQLYVMHIDVIRYNYDDVIDPSTGELYTGLTVNDIKDIGTFSCKSASLKDQYSLKHSDDPFNNADEKYENTYSYIENRILFSDEKSIRRVEIVTLILPTIEQVFSTSGQGGNSNSPAQYRFTEHYQKQILQMAVRKMSGNVSGDEYQIKQIEASL